MDCWNSAVVDITEVSRFCSLKNTNVTAIKVLALDAACPNPVLISVLARFEAFPDRQWIFRPLLRLSAKSSSDFTLVTAPLLSISISKPRLRHHSSGDINSIQ